MFIIYTWKKKEKEKEKEKKKKIVLRSGGMWLTYIKSECDKHISRATDRVVVTLVILILDIRLRMKRVVLEP